MQAVRDETYCLVANSIYPIYRCVAWIHATVVNLTFYTFCFGFILFSKSFGLAIAAIFLLAGHIIAPRTTTAISRATKSVVHVGVALTYFRYQISAKHVFKFGTHYDAGQQHHWRWYISNAILLPKGKFVTLLFSTKYLIVFCGFVFTVRYPVINYFTFAK